MSEKKKAEGVAEKLDALLELQAKAAEAPKRFKLFELLGGSETTLLLIVMLVMLVVLLNPGGGIDAEAYLEGGGVDSLVDLLKIALPGYFLGRPLSHGLKGYRAKKDAEAEALKPKE